MRYNKSHGMSRTRFYRIWWKMKERCTDQTSTNYHKYGAKGVTICERWLDFNNFYEDMYSTYTDELTLDRIENEKGYTPENCRWATYKEQNRNKTDNTVVEYKGETLTLAEIVEKYNLKKNTFFGRLRLGWSLERAIEDKVRKQKQKE
jgi:hypothetical protein